MPAFNPSPISKPSTLLQKKQKMSLSQTYFLAHTARGKLSKEAARADHDLRVLVGHANLLDDLMVDLADAEREQESWFNETVRSAATQKKQDQHISWSESLPAVTEDVDAEADDSSSEVSDDDESDEELFTPAPRSLPTIITTTTEMDLDEDDVESDDESDDESLQLMRTPSRSSPPELLHESDSDESEDDSMPPSPPAPRDVSMPLPAPQFSSQKKEIQQEHDFYNEGFYLPPRQAVAAY